MAPFHVVSIFTNVPLEETTNIIIKIIYDKNNISTNITKQKMKESSNLFTKNTHFALYSKAYEQVDGTAIESPLGSVLANIF